MNHDIIVVGASAGGVAPLLELAAHLPAGLRASLFVVLHIPSGWHSPLPELLSARGVLPARNPLHGERLAAGHIYVAPADNQLLLRPGGVMEVVRGPRENGHRPSVDALFRSAAAAYGPRVIGVVLSGHQSCGTAGLLSIQARGGISVVQDPATAEAPEMPRTALDSMTVDHVVAPLELAALLTTLVEVPADVAPRAGALADQLEGKLPGVDSGLICPECHAALKQTQAGGFEQFRCHVGHTFSVEGLLRSQNEDLERALWSAVRVLEDSATLARRLAGTGSRELRARFAEKAQTHAQQAQLIRDILLRGTATTLDESALV